LTEIRRLGDEGNIGGIQILKNAQNLGLLPSLLEQLQKDYERAGLQFPIQENHMLSADLSQIYAALKENLYRVLMEHFDDYLNLMYAIDVPEKAFKDIQPRDAVEAAAELSGLVLKREWQKIELRRRFSGADPAQK
jgi:predicted amino acid-binding ACT domain protein